MGGSGSFGRVDSCEYSDLGVKGGIEISVKKGSAGIGAQDVVWEEGQVIGELCS